MTVAPLSLIEPDGRISRIRLSDKVHAFAHEKRRGSFSGFSKPRVSSR